MLALFVTILLCSIVLTLLSPGLAFLLAALAPMYLIGRFHCSGCVASVVLGWGVIHISNVTAPRSDPVDGVFTGLWVVCGPIVMTLYCLCLFVGIHLAVELTRVVHSKSGQPLNEPAQADRDPE